jgi:hypothetical protein
MLIWQYCLGIPTVFFRSYQLNAKTIHHLCLIAGFAAVGLLSACDNRTAEQKGADMAGEKLDVATGIGNALGKKGEAAGEAVASGVGKVFSGVDVGINKSSGRKIAADESLAKAGLKVTKVQDSVPTEKDKSQGLELYVVADAAAKGKLKVVAFDVLDNEIARTSIDLVRAEDQGEFQKVKLDERVMLSAISKVAISFKPGDAKN